VKPIVNYCGRQTPDNITVYSPARCLQDDANKEGDQCTRSCVQGYEIRSSDLKTITCQADGRWRGWFSSNYCVGMYSNYCVGMYSKQIHHILSLRDRTSDRDFSILYFQPCGVLDYPNNTFL